MSLLLLSKLTISSGLPSRFRTVTVSQWVKKIANPRLRNARPAC